MSNPSRTAAVDVWYARTPTSDDRLALQMLADYLTSAERDQESRYRLPELQAQFRLTRALARSVLAEQAGCGAGEIEFEAGPYGKPYLSHPHASCAFNISHTRGAVLLALSTHGQVGVDVERLDRQVNLQLADRYFAPLEVEQLTELDVDRRSRRFMQLWTLKEAFIKGLGTGLATPLHNFAFDFAAHSEPAVHVYDPDLGPPARWAFQQFQLDDEFLAAVGLLDSGAAAIDVHVHRWTTA